MKNRKKMAICPVRLLLGASLIAPAVAIMPAAAQTSDVDSGELVEAQPAIEGTEIVVTARKREETAQDVPISIGVVSQAAIARTGLSNLLDMPSIAPGVTISKPPAGAEPGVTIRGLGSAPGAPSFDSSVSLFVDGVYAPRAREFAGSLFDVQRLEVIRGTQAALLGKNTSLGAINLITRKPGHEFAIDARVNYDFELGSHLVTGGVDVPIADTLRLRLSGKNSFEGGWVHNSINDKDNARTRSSSFRGILVWEPSYAVDITALAQHDLSRMKGNPTEFIETSAVPAPLVDILQGLGGFPGTIDTKLDRRNATYFVSPGREQTERLLIDRYSLTANFKAGDFTITSVSGFSKYRDENDFDADSQAGQYATRSLLEKSEQFSQELRLLSPSWGTFDFLVGGLYLDNKLFNQTTIAADYPFGPDPVNLPGVLLSGTSRTDFDQRTHTYSLFGQGTLHLNQALRLVGGLRYTHEDKKVQLGREAEVPGFYSLVANPPYAPFQLKRSEDSVDYSGGIQYDITPDALAYLSYGKGTKSGGFASSATFLDRSEYSDEVARTWEAGLKLQDPGRKWLLNVAVFNSDVDGFQTVTFNGLSFDITNQNLRSRGFEVESWWSPVPQLRLFANATYAHVRDRASDARVPLAPELQGSAGFTFKTGLTGDVELGIDGSIDHRSSRTSQNDPAVPASVPFTPVNASISVGSRDQAWEVRLIGRNLANDNSAQFVFPTPFLPAGNYNAVSERPRTLTLQLSVKY